MIPVSILGVRGYTGGELLTLLLKHPRVGVVHVSSESSPGERVDALHPHLRGRCSLVCESPNSKFIQDTEVGFLALPAGVGISWAVKFLKAGKRVVDLSADFRLQTPKIYTEWYRLRHKAPGWLKKAVYGLPEIFKRKIRQSPLVANPGCYATAACLSAVPLLEKGWVEENSLVFDAKSGVSGAGRKMSGPTLFSEANENLLPYSVPRHRHIPEIEQTLFQVCHRSPVPVTFVPHLVPMTRGISLALYAKLKKRVSPAHIRDLYLKRYRGEPFVRVLPLGIFPETKSVAHTNFCDLGIAVDERTQRVLIFAALDNLGKGAAGQAIQNMNVMLNLPETEGLL